MTSLHPPLRFVLSVFLLGLTPTLAQARSSQWWYVSQGMDRVLFIDAPSIERDGDVVSYWARQVLRDPDDPAALLSAYMRMDCKNRQETFLMVTRYGANDERLDASSASYGDPQPIVSGTLGEAELDFVCAADPAATTGFPIAIDEVAFAEALIADTEGSVSPGDRHEQMRADPTVPVIRSAAPAPDSFGTAQHMSVGQPIVPPRDYAKGTDVPISDDYDADETGTIYDIAYQGIEKGQMVFEQRGYSISDLAHPGSGQMMRYPLDQKKIQILDIAIEIIAADADGLRYKVTRAPRENGGF